MNTRQQQNIAIHNRQHNMKTRTPCDEGTRREQDMNHSFRNRNGSTPPTTATAVYERFLRPTKNRSCKAS